MPRTTPLRVQDELALMGDLFDPRIADDPEQFVRFCYPWSTPGTPLERFTGPRGWQRECLQTIRDHIARNRNQMRIELPPMLMKDATSSGRGIGKSSLVSWLVHWMMSTRLGSTSIVTANTEQQLKSRTWAELGKWITLAINGHWFDKSALILRPAEWFGDLVKKSKQQGGLQIDTGYYYAMAQLWSEENPDAFAGAHNPLGILVIYDEASGIPQKIWDVTEGFFTEPEIDRYWLVFSNPRRNTGAFFECFHKARDHWNTRVIDARTVEGTDPAIYDGIIAQHGADSYQAHVEVYGKFPPQGEKQFISRDLVAEAQARVPVPDPGAPLILGVDVARFGSDSSVWYFRQGRDGRGLPYIKMRGLDNMQVAYKTAELMDKYKPDAVFIDAGNGTGVIDRLREMRYRVHEVWFGSASSDPHFANKRTEMWDRLREWLRGGAIPDARELADDLLGPEYDFQGRSDKVILEPKEKMKERGLASPDVADALALTFAGPVARNDAKHSRNRFGTPRQADNVDYDLFS